MGASLLELWWEKDRVPRIMEKNDHRHTGTAAIRLPTSGRLSHWSPQQGRLHPAVCVACQDVQGRGSEEDAPESAARHAAPGRQLLAILVLLGGAAVARRRRPSSGFTWPASSSSSRLWPEASSSKVYSLATFSFFFVGFGFASFGFDFGISQPTSVALLDARGSVRIFWNGAARRRIRNGCHGETADAWPI